MILDWYIIPNGILYGRSDGKSKWYIIRYLDGKNVEDLWKICGKFIRYIIQCRVRGRFAEKMRKKCGKNAEDLWKKYIKLLDK
jgi:hypothetical protein